MALRPAPNRAGDQVIICNSVYLDEGRLTSLKPKVLTFDRGNHVSEGLTYSVELDVEGRYTFDITNQSV